MKRVKSALKQFLFQSFRPHSKEEYADIFLRGLKKRDGENRTYPWFYLRVFAVLTVVYCIYAVIISALPGAGDRETFYFVGAGFMDFALLVLLFELYPKNDFSLLALLGVCVIGGTFSDFLSAFFYYFHGFETLSNGWKLAVIAGVTEEIAKAVPAILCIVILKKKEPIAGFLIGAAVGTWFSVTENASYIHTGSVSYMVLTATVRAFGCVFSHAAWTALICWAFNKFKKPFLNVRFYGVVLLCMALHFCIDMPLENYLVILFAEAAVCGLTAFVLCVIILYKERAPHLATENLSDLLPTTYERKFNITMTGFGAAMCAAMLLLAAFFSTVSYKKVVFDSVDKFISFAQSGKTFDIDYDREYDIKAEKENYFAQYEKGKLTVAHQLVEGGEFDYVYCYNLVKEPIEGIEPTPENLEFAFTEKMRLAYVYLLKETDGEEIKYYRTTYMLDGVTITFYELNPVLDEGRISYEDRKFVFYRRIDRLTYSSIALICLNAVIGAGWLGTYLTMKKKLPK